MKLTIELVPETSWYNNLRSLMPKEKWEELRKNIVAEYNNRCAICDAKGYLECHEVWDYNDIDHIQKLIAIIPICGLCHAVKHIGRTGNQSKEAYENAVAHFTKVNKCDRITFQREKLKAFEIWEERSKHEWRIDIGEYQGVNFMI